MTAQQKMGYAAALANLEKALAEVQRCAVITQVGLNHVVSLNDLAKRLDETVWSTRAERTKRAPRPQPAVYDKSPMRPTHTGD